MGDALGGRVVEGMLRTPQAEADIIRFAKAFNLPPPEGTAADLITTMLKRSGLKQYVVFLQSASNLAANQKKPISWDHFVAAHDKIQSLNRS